MDDLAGLLDGPRARGAFLLRSVLDPPWAIRVEDRAPLTVVTLVRGGAWILPDGGDPRELVPGDVAVFSGPHDYTIADDIGTAPQIVIHPGQFCSVPGGAPTPMVATGTRSWGNNPAGATIMVTGTYQLSGEISRRLLAALPPHLVVGADQWDNPWGAHLAAEVTATRPGQEAVLDRLLDLLVIAVLRVWFSRPEARAPGWYRAHSDPVVGPALRLLQDDPAQPWTVAALAARTGVSRAALARRFTDLVGEPPIAYLTQHRLDLAADLLCEPGTTVAAVARQVGYGSAFALSTAFKRVRGCSPREHRAAG